MSCDINAVVYEDSDLTNDERAELRMGEGAFDDAFRCSFCGGISDIEDSVRSAGGLLCMTCADHSTVWQAITQWKAAETSQGFEDWLSQANPPRLCVGADVWWSDPDQGFSSGHYRITAIHGDIFIIRNEAGSEAEVPHNELTLVSDAAPATIQ